MEEEDDDDGAGRARKQNIAKLIDAIRTRRTKRNSIKRTEMASTEAKITGKGRHTKYKLHIGWQNYGKGGYHLVSAKTGGGIRTIEYSKEDPQTVTSLIDLGKKLFFPGGKSSLGYLNEFIVSLANYKSDSITEFRDLEGKICSFQEYLKSHGIFSSRFNIYLRTSRKTSQSTEETDSSLSEKIQHNSEYRVESFLCNGEVPRKIVLEYSKKKISMYSSNEITIKCHSLKDCFMLSGMPQEFESEYNAIDDGFTVSSIALDGKNYLSGTVDGEYHFSQSDQSVSNNPIVLHGPSEIFGIEENNLILGLITTHHNRQSATYHWYKDGDLYVSGSNLSIIPVKEPGIYVGAVETEDFLYLSDPPVTVVQTSSEMSVVTAASVAANVSSVLQSPLTTSNMQVSTSQTSPATVSFSGETHVIQSPSSKNVISVPRNSSLPKRPNILQSPSSVLPDRALSSLEDVSLNVSSGVQSSASEMNESAVQTNPSSMSDFLQTMPSDLDAKVFPEQTRSPLTINAPHTEQSPSAIRLLPFQQISEMRVDASCVDLSSVLEGNELTGQTNQLKLDNGPDAIHSNSAVNEFPDQIASPLTVIALDTKLSPSTVSVLPTQTLSEMAVNASCLLQSPGTERYDASVLSNQPMPGNHPNIKESPVNEPIVTNPLILVKDPCVKHLTVANISVGVMTTPSLLYTAPDNRFETLHSEACHQCTRKISSNKRVCVEEINVQQPKKASLLGASDIVTGSKSNDNVSSVPRIEHCDISIGKEIGQGAFGVVFKGEWIETPVAIKKIKVKRMKIFEKTLHRELQIHSRIRHPNIVQLMAYTTDKDSLYLVSEYIEGYNLEEIVFGKENDVPCLDIGLKCSISKDLLQAISYLHNINPVVVHRDIKPENVLVSKNLKTVKLCDMGLSKLKTMTTLVTTFACKQAAQPGTPAYQAPELVVERKSATCNSDIWSLCCALVEILTEEQVWNLDYANGSDVDGDDDDMSFVNSIAKRMKEKQSPDGLSILINRSDIPREVVDIITRGLSYDKDKRPTALDLLKVFKTV